MATKRRPAPASFLIKLRELRGGGVPRGVDRWARSGPGGARAARGTVFGGPPPGV